MSNINDFIGQTYGFLTVVSLIKESKLVCKCKCGNTYLVARCNWLDKKRRSCGCWRKANAHDLTNSPTYRSWRALRDRCDKVDDEHYPLYGGRGIIYDTRWSDFRVFLSDMGIRPDGKTLDRKDVNGMYSKENCRWSGPKEQANNRRDNIRLEFNGKSQTIMQWAEELGVKWDLIRNRLERGWPVDLALTMPVGSRFHPVRNKYSK